MFSQMNVRHEELPYKQFLLLTSNKEVQLLIFDNPVYVSHLSTVLQVLPLT